MFRRICESAVVFFQPPARDVTVCARHSYQMLGLVYVSMANNSIPGVWPNELAGATQLQHLCARRRCGCGCASAHLSAVAATAS
jgi:hypothetical protein